MNIKPVLIHTVEKTKAAYSYVAKGMIPAHDRHTLVCGEVTVTGCPSLEAATRLLNTHIFAARRVS